MHPTFFRMLLIVTNCTHGLQILQVKLQVGAFRARNQVMHDGCASGLAHQTGLEGAQANLTDFVVTQQRSLTDSQPCAAVIKRV